MTRGAGRHDLASADPEAGCPARQHRLHHQGGSRQGSGLATACDRVRPEPDGHGGARGEVGPDAATLIGKRYVDAADTVELLCTSSGAGVLTCDGAPMSIKAAKPLPASVRSVGWLKGASWLVRGDTWHDSRADRPGSRGHPGRPAASLRIQRAAAARRARRAGRGRPSRRGLPRRHDRAAGEGDREVRALARTDRHVHGPPDGKPRPGARPCTSAS
jgi:hypothetical protein